MDEKDSKETVVDEAQQLASAFLEEIEAPRTGSVRKMFVPLTNAKSARDILSQSPEVMGKVCVALLHKLREFDRMASASGWDDKLNYREPVSNLDDWDPFEDAGKYIARLDKIEEESHAASIQRWQRIWMRRTSIFDLMESIMNKKPPLSSDDKGFFLECWLASTNFSMAGSFDEIVLNILLGSSDDATFRHCYRDQIESIVSEYERVDRGIVDDLKKSLGLAPDIPLEAGEAWTDEVCRQYETWPANTRVFWKKILEFCAELNASHPTNAWRTNALHLIGGESALVKTAVTSWLPLVARARSANARWDESAVVGSYVMSNANSDVLRGLAWMCGLFPDKEFARSIGDLAVTCYKKIPGIGARAVRVGNACITALEMMGTTDALGQIALLKARVKFGGAQAAIDKALNKLAEKLGMPRDDLEEMSVPSYGMTEVGSLAQQIGDFTAELRIIDSRSTELAWKRADGKPQKSLPAAVEQEHAEEVKELMGSKKDIEKMLPAQSERLDNLYLQRKSWSLAVWRERYLDHPLVGALARRLIWNFTVNDVVTAGLWLDGRLVDRSANALSLPDDAVVTLWHPLDQPVDVVLGWRGFLEEWEITQPFKQAHREVYLLTPAEEQTRVYSNRFAAHLLRQHQFNALCAARGWKNKLRLMVDADYPPATRWLHAWNLRAEYWIEGAGTEYGTDTLESGAYRYVSADQVRFYALDAAQVTAHAGGGGYGPGYQQPVAAEPLLLAEIPPLVFSEIMRDVDLFVGVASVGNDPNWLDGGTNEGHRAYWQSVSFGELNATAQTRKAILERLVPKLKIAKQCSFADKFLVVAGKRHSYKIHLGSGNILIAPQDKYLCIVPAQAQVDKAGEKLFLPFEGDRVLSVILSKAFLLAADDKITDATILRQLA